MPEIKVFTAVTETWRLFKYLKLFPERMSYMSKSIKKQTSPYEDVHIQDFLDMISPSMIRFFTDYIICGNTFRCVWALREYPTATDEQAILRHLGEKDGVTLHIYTRHVTHMEEKKIISKV